MASWSSLTDSMLQDDLEERREAFVSYMRWKRQQSDRSRWFPRIILDYFGSGSENSGEDFGRSRVEQHGIGGDPTDAGGVRNSGTQTDLEAPPLESSSGESESDSTRRERYRHLSMDETSNPDLWMEVHHHGDMDADHMDVDGGSEVLSQGAQPDVEPHPYPEYHDMHRARNRAIRRYELLRQEAVDRNDLDELDALERTYEWLYYV